MAKKALITGVTGQDGSYLADLLLEKDYEVYGMVRRSSMEKFDRIEHIKDRIQIRQADLLDQYSIIKIIEEVQPDEVYNLAAMSFVPTSWDQPVLTAEFTAIGVTRMLEAIRARQPEASVSTRPPPARCSARSARSPRPRSPPSIRAAPTAWPRSTATGSRSTTAKATTSSPSRASSSTTSRPAAASSSSPARSPTMSPASSWASRKELHLGNLDAKRDWGYAGTTSRPCG